jgi:DNA modification methylase
MVDFSGEMAGQTFKSLYFRDFPGADAGRTLTLAIGERDRELARTVQGLSSCEVRSILGHESFQQIREAADTNSSSINAYCVRRLRTWYVRENVADQPRLPVLEDSHIHSTFRSGKTAPLHRWFPFLEGYSPEFVNQILDRYAPDARRIGDPFAGVGTTPIVAAARGISAFYSELSPLLQLLIEAKVSGLTLRQKERTRIVEALLALSANLDRRLSSSAKDDQLARDYSLTFGDSQFFDGRTFETIQRARTLLDVLALESTSLARFATIAACAALVPSSLLCRAGDLRFRRGKELDEIEDFAAVYQRQLRIVAEDLAGVSPIARAPVLIAGDAKHLDGLPSLDLDAVVTSPPYLNGTNYFRNTKIEMWFLRSIRSGTDLRALRSLAVTAGINDVNKDKQTSPHDAVRALVKKLEAKSYDSRIPRMVSAYFSDMARVLAGLSHHVIEGGLLALDIGDSVYAGVRVPTDELLVALSESSGFQFENRIILRKRVSRDTSPLTQVLLLLRRTNRSQRRASAARSPEADRWRTPWEAFKRDLPHQQAPFAARNWGHPLHSLCSYQGKMKPALAHHLVRTFVPPGGRVLDPFAGVGTIPF